MQFFINWTLFHNTPKTAPPPADIYFPRQVCFPRITNKHFVCNTSQSPLPTLSWYLLQPNCGVKQVHDLKEQFAIWCIFINIQLQQLTIIWIQTLIRWMHLLLKYYYRQLNINSDPLNVLRSLLPTKTTNSNNYNMEKDLPIFEVSAPDNLPPPSNSTTPLTENYL